MLWGNPDGAKPNPGSREKYLLTRPQYALSYNETLRFPNWVAWHLGAADMGSTPRGNFAPDPLLPAAFTRITPRDYTGTGYDRGHNCPSGDRTATKADNDATFYMTNMTPQTHAMNAGPWENLESYCRELAKSGSECYIVCGHGFDKGKTRSTVGPAAIAVPDWGWKVVVVLPEGAGDDRRRITKATRVIAVKMPNAQIPESDPWQKYTVTPAEIEGATGLKFFHRIAQRCGGRFEAKARQRRGRAGQPSTPPRTDNTSTKAERTARNPRPARTPAMFG
jgi:endonuclease G